MLMIMVIPLVMLLAESSNVRQHIGSLSRSLGREQGSLQLEVPTFFWPSADPIRDSLVP